VVAVKDQGSCGELLIPPPILQAPPPAPSLWA
jgi:hypothetical protein